MKNFVIPGARTERLAGKTELSFERMTEFLTAYSTAMKQIKQQGLKKKKVCLLFFCFFFVVFFFSASFAGCLRRRCVS